MWSAPQAIAKQRFQPTPTKERRSSSKKSSDEILFKLPALPESDEEDDGIALQDAVFDPEKAVCCSVEGGHTLLHGSGGRGYGLGATGITAGCYQWKVGLFTDLL